MVPARVDPGADGADLAVGAQIAEGGEAAVDELPEPGLVVALGEVVVVVQVVDQQHVDFREPQALQAVLVGPDDAVVAVVEAHVELERIDPRIALQAWAVACWPWLEQPADLGRQRVLRLRLVAQELPDAVLAQPQPVPGGGIEVADAGIPGRLQGSLGVGVGHGGAEIADRCAAVTELGELDRAGADAGALGVVHRVPLGLRQDQDLAGRVVASGQAGEGVRAASRSTRPSMSCPSSPVRCRPTGRWR